MTLGERIKELRKQKRITQTELADMLGVTKGTVSTWETNSRKPTFDTLVVLCDMFRVNLDYLMGRSDNPEILITGESDLEKLALDAIAEELSDYALKYIRLDEYGRNAVESIIQAEFRRCLAESKLTDGSKYKVNIRLNLDDWTSKPQK